ncbi:type 2 isopentenyl-diphosphate Delta-isomerase [Lactococcus garvieae subsp. garvieae]|uniref:type 2 isopentenyl-diphosphate Delta-isomerase n=1 Tax=Lactococcus garvieae TaxID=1363 RepID=UPI0005AB2977|nr:type 2 isopentenyl-diphosphate Delta-isomerase [Lactococcus garvieae]KAA8718290.1 type 2 isopentenyl-diphosphate Delta-isomerase [Lactococcus garvieae subsp. garvieae]MDG6190781.1 type 2 isopentenyl-diphosphate Delta-isomerase [Lactococcus garvieae]QPR48946.1 type 2 isopentenyl-diphosphate Delta-isomerase [Lactococcus garvieae]
MSKEIHGHRKDEHLSLGLKYWREGRNRSEFSAALRIVPNGLPEISTQEVDLSVTLLEHKFDFPFYIEAMTGGSKKGDKVNLELAEIAAHHHIAMAVGSQSIALKYPELAEGFRHVRQHNPKGFIFANMGAGHSLENAQKAVEMLSADALEIHINTGQELVMKDSEGDRSFYWLENINRIAENLDVPVVVKEVGFGMSQKMFKQLSQTAISGINVGGKGGTNFAWIESGRGHSTLNLNDFGFTGPESLIEAQLAQNTKPLIATGGIASATDILHAQLLGAPLASSAGHVLSVLHTQGPEALDEMFSHWKDDLTKLYTLVGAREYEDLTGVEFIYDRDLKYFREERKDKQIIL